MDYQFILVSEEVNICIITLNRPQALNALNREMVLEISQAFKVIETNDNIRCVIINGEKNFAAGADIGNMVNMTPEEAKDFAFGSIYSEVERCSKPTIAVISGFALGGGLELALACDLRIASPDAHFGFPEINLGIFPGAGGTQRLPRLIGTAHAKEMIFLGTSINVEKAYTIGLINGISDSPMAKAKSIATKLAHLAPVAMQSAKQCVNMSADMDSNVGMLFELNAWSNLFATQDQKEGMSAFLEKRKPDFTGK